jgi:hypothetical protein
MASTYTLNNGIELIGTGEQSGTWGATTNTNFDLVDTALDGQVSILLAGAGSSGSPNNLPVSDGSASNGRNRMITFTDGTDLGATAYVQLTPNDSEKIIYVRNDLSGSRSIILFQGTYNASNDYEIPAGTTAVVYFDGGGAGAVAANVFNNAYFDGLTVDGDATISSAAGSLYLEDNNYTAGQKVFGVTSKSGDLFLRSFTDDKLTATNRFGIDHSTGDISFYEDTGTTPKFFWDASEESLGIGTSSPAATFHANSGTANLVGLFESTDAGATITLIDNSTTGGSVAEHGLNTVGDQLEIRAVDNLSFETSGDERMHITSTGSVGIGTDTPAGVLQVKAANPDVYITSDNTGQSDIYFGGTTAPTKGRIQYSDNSDFMALWTNSGQRMTIDSSGNVGIGTSSPAQKLHIDGVLLFENNDEIRFKDSGATQRTAIAMSSNDLNIGTSAGGNLKFYNGSSYTERMRIDSIGNVGIGTGATVSANLHVNSGAANLAGLFESTDAGVTITLIDDSTTGGSAAEHGLNTVGDQLEIRAVDNLSFETSGDERMHITATGSVGIGTDTPGTLLNLAGADTAILRLENTDTTLVAEQLIGGIDFFANDGSTNGTGAKVQIKGISTSAAGTVTALTFGTSGSTSATAVEVMRIDASGNVLVAKTAATGATVGVELRATGQLIATASGTYPAYINRLGTDGAAVTFAKTDTVVGTISVTGSATAYNTSSDYRLKEAWVPMTGASERVQALKPINFAWKADGSRVDGFLAHEAQAVVPECVTGTKDAMMDEEYEVTPAVYEDIITPAIEAVAEVPAVYDVDGVLVSEMVPAVEAEAERTEQRLVTEAVMGTRSVPDMQGIDQSKLVPLLTAALQEALTAITDLKARVAALET